MIQFLCRSSQNFVPVCSLSTSVFHIKIFNVVGIFILFNCKIQYKSNIFPPCNEKVNLKNYKSPTNKVPNQLFRNQLFRPLSASSWWLSCTATERLYRTFIVNISVWFTFPLFINHRLFMEFFSPFLFTQSLLRALDEKIKTLFSRRIFCSFFDIPKQSFNWDWLNTLAFSFTCFKAF